MSLPDAVRFTGLQVTSLITGVMAVILGCVYFAPEEFIRRSLPPGQTSIVVYVTQLGPIWPVLFITMGMAIILAVTARRGVVAAHVLAVFGWMFYGSALLLGSLFSEPPTSVVTGSIAVGVAGIHFGLLQAHQDAGDATAGGIL
ncbi:membrane protein [Gordonia phage Mahdia]|uniref:Membrane protein n=1 Tax=Gordonia phage Mahdia TaxID=2047873 RepID=A0A2H4P9W6_9CAUD|nr:membrane protein [Gordonia phage Mahdia]ATW59022.1 membrane protein [Gordonia phage Mahdia]